jgi:hypothetical protein
MTLRRALPFVLLLAALPLAPATAQFGGMPGMPGSPGTPGAPGGFGAAPQQAPPPACQQLLANCDETQKHAMAIREAGQKKAGPEEAYKLFKTFLASETKMIKGLEGTPQPAASARRHQGVKAQHVQAAKTGKHVCDAAAQGPRPSAPSLSDALGTTPMVPDAAGAKKGAGTYDTLTGSPLQR